MKTRERDEDRVLSVFVRFFVPLVIVGVLVGMVVQSGLVSTLFLLALLLGRSMLSPAFWTNCALVAVSMREMRRDGRQ